MKKITTVFLLLTTVLGFAQNKKKQNVILPKSIEKKVLTHDVYDFWKDIPEKNISNDGQFFVYAINPQIEDGKLYFKNTSTNESQSIERGYDSKIDYDNQYAVFRIKPHFEAVKAAKKAKKKKEDLPKDSLGICELNSFKITKIPNVNSYKIPEKAGGWLAYLKETLNSNKADTTQKKSKKQAKKESEENGYGLVVRNLKSGEERAFGFVKEFEISKNGKLLAFFTSGNDSLKAGMYVLDLATKNLANIYSVSSKQKLKKIVFDENAEQLAFIADLDTNAKTQIRYPKLFYWKNKDDKASLITDESNLPSEKGWLVSQETSPKFSKDGNKLFFGTNPPPIVPDTTLLPEEIVNVEVWHWNDRKLQTQQKVTLEADKKKSYWEAINLNDKSKAQLANLDIPDIQFVKEGNADFVLGLSDLKYSNQHWDWNPKKDVYLINTKDGSKKLIKEKLEGNASVSPEGKYIYWFSNPDSSWFAYNIANNNLVRLTNNQKIKYYDEEDDHPDFPNPYGVAGWTKDDKYVLIYDRYDIWKYDPTKPESPTNLTNGRTAKTQYRYVRLDTEEKSIDFEKPLLLRTFNENSKQEGFTKLENNSQLTSLLVGDFKIGSLVLKPKNAEKILFTKETFRDFPDWYFADSQIKDVKKLTEANPQQANYYWGNVEIVKWRNNEGVELQGLLYKPENFDPSKKYPMMTYFYEKNSNNIHTHFAPKPIRSYINFSYFASNGYLVFVPDIIYIIGYPGQSAYNCVVPGVLSLIDKGFVDKDRLGISGHSWGGYQTAYIITQTNLFKAAEAGAPVSNMTSAYGGIRWESGMLRQAQYERTQTRIGGTLWEKPLQYLENSPLFHAPKIETPVLMMHNDDDGAVPWYQGIEFYAALKRLNKPVWMLNYNGEKHGLTKRQNMRDFAIRLYQYFDFYLKDAPAPSWLADGLPLIEKGVNQHLELKPSTTGKLGGANN